MAERREDLRAADVDREFVAQRLKDALDEGRLTLSEYDERLRDAYGAKTYGELDTVLADLPAVRPAQRSQVAPSSVPPPATAYRPPPRVGDPQERSTPKWLVGIWSAWAAAVLINVVIWLLVSVSSGHVVYFWPMWVAGPWGAVLLATTLSGVVNGGQGPQYNRRTDRYDRRAMRRDARRARRGW